MKRYLWLGFPIFWGLFVLLSPLAFSPVPWPDDSAFYLVAKDLLKLHRWIMSSQAAFEPSYLEWNFNTMPLYPMLLALGQILGIKGAIAIKIFPIGFWIASVWLLFKTFEIKSSRDWLIGMLLTCLLLDPTLRWASVLVRPESLVGFLGLIIVLKAESISILAISVLLALGAYAHFNAIHLVPLVAFILYAREKAIRPFLISCLKCGLWTALWLSPWLFTVIIKWELFNRQMELQWTRLAVGNDWLNSIPHALDSVFQQMGSPEEMSRYLWTGSFLFFVACATAIWILVSKKQGASISLRTKVAAVWILSSIWLWHTKPEVWFTYFWHLATWTFLLCLAKEMRFSKILKPLAFATVGIFAMETLSQAQRLWDDPSWTRKSYRAFLDCIDLTLTQYAEHQGRNESLSVWAPTYPDILVEMSSRHPQWSLTRTGDFYTRYQAGLNFARSVDAMVITETIARTQGVAMAAIERSNPVPNTWMNWSGYYLNPLERDPSFKPNRHYCRVHRWQAFIYFN